jgi:hypothetical protein
MGRDGGATPDTSLQFVDGAAVNLKKILALTRKKPAKAYLIYEQPPRPFHRIIDAYRDGKKLRS